MNKEINNKDISLYELSAISDLNSVSDFSSIIMSTLTSQKNLTVNHRNTNANISNILLKINQGDITKIIIFENSDTCSINPKFGVRIITSNGTININTNWMMNTNINTAYLVTGLLAPIFLAGMPDKLYFNDIFIGETTCKAYLFLKDFVESNSIINVTSKVKVTETIAHAYRTYLWSTNIKKCNKFTDTILNQYNERLLSQ